MPLLSAIQRRPKIKTSFYFKMDNSNQHYSDKKMIDKITGKGKEQRKPPKKKLAQVFDLKVKRKSK